MAKPTNIVHDQRLLYLVGLLLVLFYFGVMVVLNRSSGSVKKALTTLNKVN
jgi:type VI protein secretion system component VasF